MTSRISVIICTHNPREAYLQRTLQALRAQTLDPSLWELLLIDNCSEHAVEGRFDLSWHPTGRILVEEELGLTPARLRGIRESRAEILCYVDDDNVLDPNYLEQALCIGTNHPHIGCWGGETVGEYETDPPPWFSGYEGKLAVRALDRDQWGNAYCFDDASPCGAGLCVRRSVVEQYLHECAQSTLRKSLDRTGTSTMSGGDQDLVFTAIDMGMGTGRFKALRLLHLIPAARLEPEYLARLVEGMAESGVYLNSLRDQHQAKLTLNARIRFWQQWLMAPKERRRILIAQRRGRRHALERLSKMGV